MGVKAIEIDQRITVRKNFTNIVMKDQEIIRFKLKDYFGESFAYFDSEMLDHRFDPPEEIVDPNLMKITSPYSLFASGSYNLKEFTNPLKDSTTILKMYEKNSFERTYLLYVNEAYQIKIINMTFYELNMDKEIYSLDLIPIINRDISISKCDKLDSDCASNFSLRDVFCNGITAIERNFIYALSCHVTEKRIEFLIWIKISVTSGKFKLNVFAEKEPVCADEIGRNSISSFVHEGYGYLVTSSYDQSNLLCLTIFDLKEIEKDKVKLVYSAFYLHSDFEHSSKYKMHHDFNIRDTIIFTLNPAINQHNKLNDRQHFLVVTCYNNGLLFFKSVNMISPAAQNKSKFRCNHDDFQNPSALFYKKCEQCDLRYYCGFDLYKSEEDPDLHVYFYLSFIYDIKNIGRIYTEKEFTQDIQSSITFFSSTPSPPIVYEFVIDEFLNVNIKKIYEVKSDDVLRYIGNDKICANEKYIAFLLYDYRMLRQVARIYYRDETNFGVGHSNIILNGFSLDISTMKFLEFKNNDAIYLRNAQKWKVYQLNEIEFMIDTYTNDTKIDDYLFNSYEIRISCFHEYLLDKNFDKVELSFNISFTDSSDMNLHFIGDSKNKSIINSYGDPSFKIRLNNYYMGPNLIFGFELISSVPYGPNITLPKVFNTYDKSIYKFQLSSNYPCNRVLSSRFTPKNSPIVLLSLQCINDNYIERYSFTMFGQNVKYEEQKEYLTSHFIDYYITADSIKYFNNKRILVILSKEKEGYFSHIFEIQNEKIFWIDKMIVDTYNKNLREAKPIVPLAKTGWVILIEETEKELFFEPEDPKKMPYVLHSDFKVMYAYTAFGNQLYVSHYNDTKVSIYKVYRYENEEQKSTISVEFIRKHDFERVYTWFDVDVDVYGLVLAFIPKSNNIYLYQIKTIFEMKFVRIINFYVFLTNYKFLTNKNEHDIVYARKASYLYIVMCTVNDRTERALFIF